MALTSPDLIRTPDDGDQYALVQDLGAMADSIQTALSKRPLNLVRLWQGTAIMAGSTTLNLTGGTVTGQPNGIVLCWSAHDGTSAQNNDWNYTYIPKSHVQYHSGNGVNCQLAWGTSGTPRKYVYVTNTTVSGNDRNTTGGNQVLCLREIFGY